MRKPRRSWTKSYLESLTVGQLSTLRRMLPRMSRAAKNLLRRSWYFLARDDQRPPPEPWQIWLFMAGRGAGKTRTGAEYARARVKAGCRRLALIAPTAGDCRDVMVEGSSGILAVSSEDDYDYRGNYVGIPIYENADHSTICSGPTNSERGGRRRRRG